MEMQSIQNSKDNFKKDKVVKLTLYDISTYYKSSVNKSMSYWHKNRQINQQNGSMSPETDLYIWTVDKEASSEQCMK